MVAKSGLLMKNNDHICDKYLHVPTGQLSWLMQNFDKFGLLESK